MLTSSTSLISRKPMLITKDEFISLGRDIKLVGIDTLSIASSELDRSFSPRLLNYVEPYDFNGKLKTLFYTEVNSNLKIGDKAFIINGNYDNDLLIKNNKYKKGVDGYKILYIENCKIVLDIDYTGVPVYTEDIIDNFIKVYYIRDLSEFINANREITTRSGDIEYKFNYYQNNIAYIDGTYSTTINWGFNGGVTGSPGFYVKNGAYSWTNITSEFMSGSFSYSLSPIYYNNNRVKIMSGNFTYDNIEFKESFIYKWSVGSTNSIWEADPVYFNPIITKNNFRGGIFNGTWNSGLFGCQDKNVIWDGERSTWNIGTLLNAYWVKGNINSLYTSNESYFSGFNQSGVPYQKVNSNDNAGRGYNFIIDSKIESSIIYNGSFYKTIIGSISSTYSVVENEILQSESPYINNIKKAFFKDCQFNNSYISNSELDNIKSNNSKFEKSKSINSYFKNSVFKNSNYNSENIIKIKAYDEFIASESQSISSTFSIVNDSVQKIYKFYIDKDGFDRLKSSDVFYIKGIKINNNKKDVINFFDKKFKISSWTEYSDELISSEFIKRGFEYSAFLSTPYDNSFKYTSVSPGLTDSFYTRTYATNSNNQYYSIDIWVSRYDITGLTISENINFNRGSTSSIDSLIIDPHNYGNIIDINNAYIINSDFDSGLFENSDWNSGYYINRNNDLNISGTYGSTYSISFNGSGNIVATTSYNSTYNEGEVLAIGDVVFLDSVDFTYGISPTTIRLPEAYKIISNTNGIYELSEIIVGTSSQIQPLTASVGYFNTQNAQNRYGYIKNLKINKSNIKSGILKRPYITQSLIQNSNYDQFDKDYSNLEKIRSIVISDSIFSNKLNTLSLATYIYSYFLNGSDTWYSGIIDNSIWNGLSFSNGVIKNSRWVDGIFNNGYFYNSRTFNGNSSATNPYYYSENINSYYKDGPIPNNRNSWQNGIFNNGEFNQSDWENGTFSNGSFLYSNWYDGVFSNGVIGSNLMSFSDTKFFNGTISYATVNNASIFAQDTSYVNNITQNIYWLDGIFNDGIFGCIESNSSTWYNGSFNGGQFASFAKWKNGKFNGGKFLSGYGWTQSSSLNILDYSWENGKFNGGEFGNAQGLTNSTWYTGEFNNGIFKGRLWNDGIFLYGEFQGSGTYSPVAGTTCSNASNFNDSFTYSYYGYWRNGIFTSVKDRFVKNEKIWTTISKALSTPKSKSSAIFKNALWESGTFSHQDGVMRGSIWLDGSFEFGKFINSSFNPYVRRNGSTQSSFNLNDNTCYWENGEFENSDFYISHWKNGKFIIGTATGMIFENGVVDYMNAFNVFWENGIWRNGNWYGSPFEFDGEVIDDYTRQILFRGMSWSGTSSCHLWNIFNISDNKGVEILEATASNTTNSGSGWVSSSLYNNISYNPTR